MTAFGEPYFLAWTTTPWTLPSNTALCVGPNIDYNLVQSYNPYTGVPISVIVAKVLVRTLFNPKAEKSQLLGRLPSPVTNSFRGKSLQNIKVTIWPEWSMNNCCRG